MVRRLISFLIALSLMGLSSACTDAKLLRSGGLTCEEKKVIVDVHNKLRQKIALGTVSGQSAAANMLEMNWDDELAKGAQNWANKCNFQHDTYKQRKVSRFEVGQNLAMSWSSPSPNSLGGRADFETQINNWFNEVKDYKGYFTTGVGHYTQVVWSDSYLVGCGYTYYQRGNKYTKLYVCNYGPAGNIQGTDPYKKGEPACTQHGKTPSSKYKGLCTVPGNHKHQCSHYFNF